MARVGRPDNTHVCLADHRVVAYDVRCDGMAWMNEHSRTSTYFAVGSVGEAVDGAMTSSSRGMGWEP
jgi:hypothetical protein